MSKPWALIIGAATDRMRDRLAEVFDVRHSPPSDLDAVLAAHGAEIGYLLSNGHGGVPAALMDRMPGLRIISNYGVGYDSIDTGEAVRRGIVVTHTPDVLNDDVANCAILLLLAASRNFLADNAYLRARRWPAEGEAPPSRGLRGRTVGILGLGRIGMAVAEKLAVFGVEIVYHTRARRDVPFRFYDDLTAMARDCDVLICVAPGGAATRGIVNRQVIEALGPDGILVNVGRGSVVDEPELIAALRDGRLGKAGLDVFADEPHVPPELMALENATLLPHVASATVETRVAMGDLAVENLLRFHAAGRAVTPVPECLALVRE